MFQLITNIPVVIPTIAAAAPFTFPKYSGARNSASAPKVFMKFPVIVAKSITQKISSTWNFLKCKISSCTGNE